MANNYNYINEGDTYTKEIASGGTAVDNGEVTNDGDLCGVASEKIPAGEKGTVHRKGRYRLAANTTAFTKGQRLHWDYNNEELINTSAQTGDLENFAIAAEAKAAATLECEVILTPERVGVKV